MTLSANLLETVLEEEPGLIEAALKTIYLGETGGTSFSELVRAATITNMPLPKLLLDVLVQHEKTSQFMAVLQANGRDTAPDLAASFLALGGAAADDLPLDELKDFVPRIKAFRCRILVDGQVLGSGAWVSPRLVITSAHVINTITNNQARNPKLEILASDEGRYDARVAWFSPVHPDEVSGGVRPDSAADTHCDTALLRIEKALGIGYGRIDLPDEPAIWTGRELFLLIQFPAGETHGLSVGELHRRSNGDLHQLHDVNTAQGSSGGAGFDRSLCFMGIHQGRQGTHGRLIPFERFAQNNEFREQIRRDKEPVYLWSVDGSLESNIIIGRRIFFETLNVMASKRDAKEAPQLRGLWVKREQIKQRTGLGFGFQMLTSFFAAHEGMRNQRAFKVSPSAKLQDFYDQTYRDVLGEGAPPAAISGVRQDETTIIAYDQDRAMTLAQALNNAAKEADEVYWLYIENPPSEFSDRQQIQLEHLVKNLLLQPNLRLILSGHETNALPAQGFESIAEARRSRAPGLLVEYVGNFMRSDIEFSVGLMSQSLGLGWDDAVQAHMVNRALRDIPVHAGSYESGHLKTVSARLQEEAKNDVGAV